MARMLRSAALTLLLPLTATAAGPVRDAHAFAQAFDHAQLLCDVAVLDTMVAADLVFVQGSGALSGKKEFIDGYSSPGLKIEPFTIEHPTYRQLGNDAAVVGGEVVLRGSDGGQPFVSHFRYSDTFVWRDGRWQVIHIQVTRIADPAS